MAGEISSGRFPDRMIQSVFDSEISDGEKLIDRMFRMKGFNEIEEFSYFLLTLSRAYLQSFRMGIGN